MDSNKNSLSAYSKYSKMSSKELFKQFHTSNDGLSKEEVEKKLKKYGLNIPYQKKSVKWLPILINQFKNLLIIILILAVLVSFLLGEIVDGTVILIILFLNILLGFFQDLKAEKSIKSLEKINEDEATVIRSGKEKVIPAKFLVPGDIIILKEGKKVPADARIIEAYELQVNESMLTGESKFVYKKAKATEEDERRNIAFAGTLIVNGYAKAVVIKTGTETELGKISELINKKNYKITPLQRELDETGKILGSLVILISLIVFLAIIAQHHLFLKIFYGLIKNNEQRFIVNALITAVALAVAAVPEGLPAIVTTTLALGVKKFLKKGVLIRKLSSVETLGSVDVICTDKTGTITKGEINVVSLFMNNRMYKVNNLPKKNNTLNLLLKIGLLCNDSNLNDKTASPTELAILKFSSKFGLDKESFKLKKIFEIPFSHERKFMLTVHDDKKDLFVSAKGAPEILLKHCSKILVNGRVKKLNKTIEQRVLKEVNNSSKNALRNLAFAYKTTKKLDNKHLMNDLIFVGFESMEDLPRPEVKSAISACMKAGIRVVMITGDHENTAVSIANQVGIEGLAVGGPELESMNDEELRKTVKEANIFFRVLPYHKLKILRALKSNNHTVAMMGDGVNDAPALKEADIGISVNSGTDVAKESADMILLNNSFASIESATAEGRKIYSNIKKTIRYLLSSNLAEVLTIFLAILFGLPLPLIAIQILWMNLLTDSFPALALGLEPMDKDIMKRKPRSKGDKLINSRELFFIGYLSLIMSFFVLLAFTVYLPRVAYARTMAFTTIVFFELANVLNSKSEFRPVLKSGIFNNPWIISSIVLSTLLQLAVVYIPFLQRAFETTALSLSSLLYAMFLSLLILLAGDIGKLYADIKWRTYEKG